MPREHLELVLWIESDRMGYMLDTLTQESLDVQRGVVQNERRQTYENAPYGPSTLALLDALFPEGHPYHGAVIGSMKDLEAAKLEDVRGFFQAYYAPSNATLAIAGDFDTAGVKQLVERYFGTLTDRPRPKRERTRDSAADRVETADDHRAGSARADRLRLDRPARFRSGRTRAATRRGHPGRRQGDAAVSRAGREQEGRFRGGCRSRRQRAR